MILVLVACQSAAGPIPSATEGGRSAATKEALPPRGAASPEKTASPATPTPADPPKNVASAGSASASSGEESAKQAIDGNPETAWNANAPPVQSFTVQLDKAYLVSRIELLITQAPAGQTTHEVWLGDASGNFTLYEKIADRYTADGETLVVAIQPGVVIDRVMIRTLSSPSFVAWREVRVFGQTPGANAPTQVAPSAAASSAAEWPQVKLTGDLELPVQIANAGDGSGRLFVVEQRGRIRVLEDGKLLAEPLLAIPERISCCGERGLLNVAFPPGFATKGRFYVSYTARSGDLVVARFRITPDRNVADPDSEEVILTIPQPAPLHNGGRLAFGPKDGYLYIGSGDGGLRSETAHGQEAQDLGSLLGKILRIDVESGEATYRIPADNPFVQTPGARAEIWALGLRNPWSFFFDRQTGDLYIGDVGESRFEEVNFQAGSSGGGENYGWPAMEGLECTGKGECSEGLTPPVAQYSHEQGCSVIGGPIYRGAQSTRMQGVYLYADLCSGRIWGMRRVGDRWQTNLLTKAPFQVSSIGEDESGNVYVASYTHGTILRVVDISSLTSAPSKSGQ